MTASRRRTSESLALAGLLAAAAGSIEAYSIVVLGVFAGAQTGNVVFASIEISRWHWSAAARYVWPILAFVFGVLVARTLLTKRVSKLVHRPYRAILTLELMILLAMGFLPDSTPRTLAAVILTVAVAAQASTFRTVIDIGYNSAFTTGNLMNAVTAFHAAVVGRNHAELVHARRVFAVIGCYIVGAIVGAISSRQFGRPGIWCGAVILAAALALFVMDERLERQSVVE